MPERYRGAVGARPRNGFNETAVPFSPYRGAEKLFLRSLFAASVMPVFPFRKSGFSHAPYIARLIRRPAVSHSAQKNYLCRAKTIRSVRVRNQLPSLLQGAGTNARPLTLLELTGLIRQTIELAMPGSYWVQAELSEVRESSVGHCYLEFVEPAAGDRGIAAKVRGMVWRNVYALLKPHFERTTGQRLQSGMKVLVCVNVSFHEQYGLSLVVTDIDPVYTLGDMARRRQEILNRLEDEGVLHMNHELTLPALVQRVAVISSSTAAGYGDFCHQLSNNARGYVFYTRLYPALMQGERVAQSIVSALNAIVDEGLPWDAVVIIRGGGAVSDLNGFESYELACNCAQYPLPIITGIGHERDDTVIDFVANTRCKTPTAVADFLITRADEAMSRLSLAATRLQKAVAGSLQYEQGRLQRAVVNLPHLVRHCCDARRRQTHSLEARLRIASARHTARQEKRMERQMYGLQYLTAELLERARQNLLRAGDRLGQGTRALLKDHALRLERAGQTIRLMGPGHLLSLGYSITLLNGRALTDATKVRKGDRLVTHVANGTVESEVL